MKKILVVDDDLDILRMYSQKLLFEGYDVLTAENGKQALSVIKESRPGLVLLDIMLPQGMNGFDVLEEMKKDKLMQKIPVIMLTNLDSEKKSAFEVGADDYLVKANTDLNLLMEKVRKLLK
jgi:DNA-binding response OmpR family regulator